MDHGVLLLVWSRLDSWLGLAGALGCHDCRDGAAAPRRDGPPASSPARPILTLVQTLPRRYAVDPPPHAAAYEPASARRPGLVCHTGGSVH